MWKILIEKGKTNRFQYAKETGHAVFDFLYYHDLCPINKNVQFVKPKNVALHIVIFVFFHQLSH